MSVLFFTYLVERMHNYLDVISVCRANRASNTNAHLL
jgi:hypothetical protein